MINTQLQQNQEINDGGLKKSDTAKINCQNEVGLSSYETQEPNGHRPHVEVANS